MKRVLVIDDKRSMKFLNEEADSGKIDLTYARTSDQGLSEIKKHHHYDEVWFDHDLGGEDTIRPVITLLEEMHNKGLEPTITTCYVHTDNPAGGDWSVAGLKNAGYTDIRRTHIDTHELGPEEDKYNAS